MSDQPLGSNADVTGSNSGQGESSPSSQPQGQPSESGNGINPAWNPLLEALPTNLHAIATPHLRQWDQNFQQRLQQEQQVYAPYKQFIDEKVDPQILAGAMQLMKLIDSDPRGFYDKMGEYYKDQWGIGQDPQTDEGDDYSLDEGDDENYQDPRFDQIKQQQDVIAQVLYQQMTEKQQQEQQAQQAQFDKQLEDEIGTIRGKYGEAFTDQALEMALSIALNSGAENLVEAADKVMAFRGNQGPSAPTVLPTSGGLPSTAVNPGQLSRKDTRALVEERFRAAFGSNHQ